MLLSYQRQQDFSCRAINYAVSLKSLTSKLHRNEITQHPKCVIFHLAKYSNCLAIDPSFIDALVVRSVLISQWRIYFRAHLYTTFLSVEDNSPFTSKSLSPLYSGRQKIFASVHRGVFSPRENETQERSPPSSSSSSGCRNIYLLTFCARRDFHFFSTLQWHRARAVHRQRSIIALASLLRHRHHHAAIPTTRRKRIERRGETDHGQSARAY